MSRTGDRSIVLAAAVLALGSAAVHAHLWDIAYRHVATLGPLFLVQAIGGAVAAAVLAVTRAVAVVIGCILLMLGTVVGFVLADTVGLFGFTLPEVTYWAYVSVAFELLSSTLLMAVLIRQSQRGQTGRLSTGSA
jgi:LytS/YehU family sensor histidine kinase